MAGTIRRLLSKVGTKKERRKDKLGPFTSVRNPVTEKSTPLFVRWRNGQNQITSNTRGAEHLYKPKKKGKSK